MGHKRFNQTAINVGQVGITESPASWGLLLGIASMGDWGGPGQEKWAAGNEHGFKESMALKKARLGRNRKTFDQMPTVGKDETSSATQKRELEK